MIRRPSGRKTTKQEGPRKVTFHDLGKSGAKDTTFYYNIIDYEGDMSDYVNLTRHDTLEGALEEAKRFALDRRWAGPGTSLSYAGQPPRIIRTVRFLELHRVEVEGPLPESPADKLCKMRKAFFELASEPAIKGEEAARGLVLAEHRLLRTQRKLDKEFEHADDPRIGQPHPKLRYFSNAGGRRQKKVTRTSP